MSKNKYVIITTTEKVTETVAKLREKGYKDMEVDPKSVEDVTVAIVTKSGVADHHPNVTSIEQVPNLNVANVDTKGLKPEEPKVDGLEMKTSGKEMPLPQDSKQVIAESLVEPGKPKEKEKETEASKKSIGVAASQVKVDESDEEADQRYNKMWKNKGFAF